MIAKEKDLTDLKNKVIIFPTDTVYGVGCLFDDLESITRIFLLKGRDFGKPMAILAANTDMLVPLVEMNAEFMALAKKHWPGALTLIARKKSAVSDLISAGKNTVGVRIPNHPTALAILEKFGPMVTTSLNQSGEAPLTRFADVMGYADLVDYLIDGGDIEGIASTVYDVENHAVLRQGTVRIK
ncbi:MAG TPA: L-threonylcarbamoyladenylate synthase [Bacillota bacterium]|nr:L-threonylcarbamoyladenylate synthase [Bacillota bacterium]HPJ86270.1 L-threonylcarbamoyladenylate synthase [Bacillota bacterium]HPQ62409.1 L-threonylcarbamoyladenylate synthase [Bacillota bacterium]HRX91972.1 L-threonylcarbamoyladenylate synthase [Candidatus Izemoplasmatales bacterium]